MNDKITREQLISLLKGGNAHMDLDGAVKDFPGTEINYVFPNGKYTFWHLLEHIRITQHDILDFTINPKYKEMEWPKGYWPREGKKATKKDWEHTLTLFNSDSKALQRIVGNPKTDLYAKIPWGDGQTTLREALLVADHNAYHIGEFAIMRQTAGNWPKSHK